jgi:hypothetical protein
MHRTQVLGTALVAAALFGGRPLAAQTGFEGVITFTNYEHGGKPSTFIQTTKGHRLRLDGFGSAGSMIIDNEAHVVMIVQPDKKQYMTMTQDDIKQMQAMMGPMMERMKQRGKSKHAAGNFTFTPTGKKETVAGVKCAVWHGEYTDATDPSDKDEGEACVANGVGFALAELTFANPMMMKGSAVSDQFEQYRQLVGGNKGLLKATRFENGQPKPVLEATAIERKAVSDDAFRPPAGYTEVRMGDMMMKAQKSMQQAPQQQQPDSH